MVYLRASHPTQPSITQSWVP